MLSVHLKRMGMNIGKELILKRIQKFYYEKALIDLMEVSDILRQSL